MSEDTEEATGVPRFLDDVQRVDRKRMRLDSIGRKRWSLTDRQSDQEVLQEMGVGILEPDNAEGPSVAGCSHASMLQVRSEPKRKRDIENVSPNVNGRAGGAGGSGGARPAARPSPRRRPSGGKCSPGSADKREARCRRASEGADAEQRAPDRTDHVDEETPLPLLPAAALPGMYHSSPGLSTGSVCSADWPTSGGSGRRVLSNCSGVASPYTQEEEAVRGEAAAEGRGGARGDAAADAFAAVSDEVMLTVFKWLPKHSLITCMLVCRKWHRIATDESLWQRMDLSGRVLAAGAIGKILARKPVVLRLASTEVGMWREPTPQSYKVQYLDLSMCVIERDTLSAVLRCCPALRKLSLETVDVDEHNCQHIGRCQRLETLNLTMATGLTADGITSILEGCTGLQSLSVSWCRLAAGALRRLARAPPVLQRLNVAGARHLTDDMVEELVERCPRLLELDASDCTQLTEAALRCVARLDRLEHLALSRCYRLTQQSLMQVSGMRSLQFLEVWGMMQKSALAALRLALPSVGINLFMHSAVARPTVGARRTSIWGLRTRD